MNTSSITYSSRSVVFSAGTLISGRNVTLPTNDEGVDLQVSAVAKTATGAPERHWGSLIARNNEFLCYVVRGIDRCCSHSFSRSRPCLVGPLTRNLPIYQVKWFA